MGSLHDGNISSCMIFHDGLITLRLWYEMRTKLAMPEVLCIRKDAWTAPSSRNHSLTVLTLFGECTLRSREPPRIVHFYQARSLATGKGIKSGHEQIVGELRLSRGRCEWAVGKSSAFVGDREADASRLGANRERLGLGLGRVESERGTRRELLGLARGRVGSRT